MSVWGLPDLHEPLQLEDMQVFYPYGGGQAFILAPDRLELAEVAPNQPDFRLELVRGRSLPEPYGILDFRLQPHYPMQDGLRLVRDHYPSATLTPASFIAGFLRFLPLSTVDPIPPELLQPVPLTWSGLSHAHFLVKLSQYNLLLLKGALQKQTLPLWAAAELELMGVSPRVPVKVQFNPAALLSALLPVCDDQQRIGREVLVQHLRKNWKQLPIQLVGALQDTQVDAFAETIADRLRLKFGSFVPSPEPLATPYLMVMTPQEAGIGQVNWDLSEPIAVPRPMVFRLDPFAAVMQLVQAQGIDAVFRETEVPAFPTGVHPISILANLPAERLGVLKLGVTLRVPPRLPQRPQAITASAELKPPQDLATVMLRLSPTEPLEYRYSTFAILKDAKGIQRLNSTETIAFSDYLTLSTADFAINFVTLEALPELLQLATIQGVCRRSDDSSVVEIPFEFNEFRSLLAIALPPNLQTATLDIELRERTSQANPRTLKLPLLPAQDLYLGLHSLAEYGPQTLEIECVFSSDRSSFAIELLPEMPSGITVQPTILNLTSSRPKRQWTWFAESPFYNGYRYREYRPIGQPQVAWSEVQSAQQRLKLQF